MVLVAIKWNQHQDTEILTETDEKESGALDSILKYITNCSPKLQLIAGYQKGQIGKLTMCKIAFPQS